MPPEDIRPEEMQCNRTSCKRLHILQYTNLPLHAQKLPLESMQNKESAAAINS